MGTQDISRNAFDSSKHYSSVRQQQGRVLTDDDWNENNRIHEHLKHKSLIDIIGSAASPDNGFLITDPVVKSRKVDFTIKAGSFYLGGQQLSLEQDQSYCLQTDWLQGPNSTKRSQIPSIDLVVLESYQQVVTAVEDSELYEVALGGADTTTRLRTLQRVHLIRDIGTDECITAWSRFKERLSDTGRLTRENTLVSDAVMSVDFVQTGTSGDLCKPNIAGGYLGAENQTIRVQLRENNTFTWGLDNGAPLYRVQLDATRTRVTLDTPPKDQYHWPQADQSVEILSWACVLENNEKIAEHEGFLSRVVAGYDPATREITLAEPVPTAGFDNWQTRDDADSLANGESHFYMRVWDRGSDRESPSVIPCDVGNQVDLGFTGIRITFGGAQLNSGDYWLISVRPSAPTEVIPWSLQVSPGKSPYGLKRCYAPLALINWSNSFVGRVRVTDCRGSFEPLNSHKCCVDLVARPGPGWHLVFDKVPRNGDAVICLPAGEYPVPNSVNVMNKGRLRITGAGKSSCIFGTGNDVTLRFSSCDRVELSQVYINSGNQHGGGIKGALSFNDVNHIEVHHTYIRTRAGRSTDIACLRVDNNFGNSSEDQGRVKIYDCEFYVGHLQTGILIVNAGYIDIRDNLLVPSGPEVESVHRSLRDKYFMTSLVNMSIVPRLDRGQSVSENKLVFIDLSDMTTVEFLTDENLQDFWQKELRTFDTKRFGGGDEGRLHQALLDLMRKRLRSRARSKIKQIRTWLSAIDGGGSAFMNQGIVIGGRRANKVTISNNEIKGATQGIHVGLSHNSSDRTKSGADIANSITIQNNHVITTLGAGSRVERHGCFVGNAQRTQILHNEFQLNRLDGTQHVEVEAIRVYGFVGPMLRVVGNYADISFSETVNINPLGPVGGNWIIVDKENFPGK